MRTRALPPVGSPPSNDSEIDGACSAAGTFGVLDGACGRTRTVQLRIKTQAIMGRRQGSDTESVRFMDVGPEYNFDLENELFETRLGVDEVELYTNFPRRRYQFDLLAAACTVPASC